MSYSSSYVLATGISIPGCVTQNKRKKCVMNSGNVSLKSVTPCNASTGFLLLCQRHKFISCCGLMPKAVLAVLGCLVFQAEELKADRHGADLITLWCTETGLP